MGSLRLIVLLALAAFGALATSQGLMWQQPVSPSVARAVVHSSGDIFVFSMPHSPSGLLTVRMQRFSSAGVLVSNVAYTASASGNPSKSFVAIRGDKIYCLISMFDPSSGERTRMYVYDIPSLDWVGGGQWLEGTGIFMETTTAAFGDTHYFIMGFREYFPTEQGFYQKRRLSDNGVVLQSNFAGYPGEVERSGDDTFIANRSTSGTPGQLMVMRIGALLDTKSVNAYDPGGLFNGVLSADGSTFYSLARSSSTFVYVRPFNVAAGTFGSPTAYNFGGAPTVFVKDRQPHGSSDAGFVIGSTDTNWFLRTTPTSVTANVLDVPGGGFARLGRDANGNSVAMMGWNLNDQRFIRSVRLSRSTGAPMNSTSFAVPLNGRRIADVLVDATGSLRFVYEIAQDSYYNEAYLAQVNPARLSVAGPFTIGGQPATGTVTLDQPAPAGGATFLLYSNNAAAVVPVSMTVPAGQTSANFTITTSTVAANAKPTINARYDGLNLQTNFDLAAPLIQSVSATPQVQYGGLTSTGTVTLTGPAPTGGKSVALSSSNTSRVTVPASVNVPAGQASANFTITNIPTLANASSVISATTGAVTRTVFVAVNAPILLNASLAQTTLKGGLSTTMALTLNAPAPSGYTVALVAGAASLVQLPSSFAIPQGATSVNVPVNSSAVTSTIAVTLVAYRGPYVRVMTLTLTP
ncbi:MAG: hypothetical protein IT363_03420 [Methanoregulaceae archaeon]|nr:hypothetical protein [Methanoregulaceae archaeon]